MNFSSKPGLNSIFVDISALEALINSDHPNHKAATQFLHSSLARNFSLLSSQQVLFALAEKLRLNESEKFSSRIVIAFRNSELIQFEPMNTVDIKETWRIFDSIQNPWWTFTRCASLALINRLNIENIFAFEPEFEKLGFRLLPKEFEQ